MSNDIKLGSKVNVRKKRSVGIGYVVYVLDNLYGQRYYGVSMNITKKGHAKKIRWHQEDSISIHKSGDEAIPNGRIYKIGKDAIVDDLMSVTSRNIINCFVEKINKGK